MFGPRVVLVMSSAWEPAASGLGVGEGGASFLRLLRPRGWASHHGSRISWRWMIGVADAGTGAGAGGVPGLTVRSPAD